MIERLKLVLKPEDWKLPIDELERRCLKNLVLKVDELVDAVNNITSVQEKLIDSRFVVETKHEAPANPKVEQHKWIGCICRFWYDNPNDTLLDILGKVQTGKDGVEYYAKESYDWFPHCEPVLPTDNEIYKGE